MPTTSTTVTADVAAYLAEQRLGRLATVDSDGAPQNNPVGFRWDPASATILVGGHNLAGSRKFRNIRKNPHVSLVVDDLFTVRPWHPRCVEVRGTAEAIEEPVPMIRIRPERVISFGLTDPPTIS